MVQFTKDLLPHYDIGEGTYGSPTILFPDSGCTLKIGKYCSIAAGVKIFLGGGHRIDWVTTYPFSHHWEGAKHLPSIASSKGSVIIENDVWIGGESLIMTGVTIGDGVVVGARSVITKDIEPYRIVAGNPGRVIGQRFDDKTIERLLAIQWWEWDKAKINEVLPLILSSDINIFLEKAEE